MNKEKKLIKDLYNAILKLKTIEECDLFFKDLCTPNELNAFAQRLEVARLLLQNKTYVEIQQVTNASTTTISRVNRTIVDGAKGYESLL
ncbi:YerC/YecD family TrpR-related protein [Candidatus Epulonipiscium viviparus]|uniref:YerC/YecD family TrpR-related protein n=1 Tax=Candidatus Epulonipiscium viviparus TaxID=420336 RepID=UPI0004963284|nr:YerC/YecD family TrpR-related protein [Candidatus Epulopiscium viviparus]